MNFQTLFSPTCRNKCLRMGEKQVSPNCQDAENKRLNKQTKKGTEFSKQ